MALGWEAQVTDNIALVGHIVRETLSRVPSYVNRDDLTSAGLIALVQAAQGYDAERGVPFTRYAALRIRGAILDELRGIDWASRSVRRRARDVEATRTRLATALGRVPSNPEIAAALGLSEEEVTANEKDISRARVLSLESAREASLDDVLPANQPGPEAVLEHRERLAYLEEAIAELPERQRIVVQEYFLAERPMAEIAQRLGVSESRISQIRAEALVLLREVLNRELDPDLATASTRPGGCADRRRQAYYDAVAARHAAALASRRTLAALDTSA